MSDYLILFVDFFDVGVMPSASTSKEDEEEEEKPSAMADILPEGFFDDPKMDAKVSYHNNPKLSGPQVIKMFSCSTQLSMKIKLCT